MNRTHWLVTITGSMFSGKTSTLLSKIQTLIKTGNTIGIFKHGFGKRYSKSHILLPMTGNKYKAY